MPGDGRLRRELRILMAELAANPKDPGIHERLGDVLFGSREYATARGWYRKASRLESQNPLLRDKADDCAIRLYDVTIEAAQKSDDPRLKDLQRARLRLFIRSFERRLNDRPADTRTRFELGKAYYITGRTGKAIAEFRKWVKDPKLKTESHFYLGRAFQKSGMFDGADRHYALAEADVLSRDRTLDILYNRMACSSEAGKKAKAVRIGKRIMEIDTSYRDL